LPNHTELVLLAFV